nr:hypothetical protein [uncultured Blautia sp.]
MLYVSYMYYENYSDPPVIKEDFWEYWESQAEREVDKKTFGRLRKDPVLITEPVKQCICEIAELLYKAEEIAEQAWQQGGAGLLESYNNDGESGTFDLSQSAYTEEGKARKIREIIYRYLSFTGLMYAGVR